MKVTDNGGLTDTFEGNVNIMSVSNEVNGAVPTEFAIAQNYPNPFNPSTNINYSLPEASKVSIVVYDMLGQRVAQLVNAEKSAGYHTVTFMLPLFLLVCTCIRSKQDHSLKPRK